MKALDIIRINNSHLGIEAKFIEVFVSVKPDYSISELTNSWNCVPATASCKHD